MNSLPLAIVGLLITSSFARANRSLRVDTPSLTQVVAADTAEAVDPITRLQRELDAGRVKLSFDSVRGYLPALLRELNVPVASQGLVFSRTSLRTDLIAPWAPRALYFNDDVYIGWVPESEFLEIGSVNPTDGVAFYTLRQDKSAKPQFTREGNRCLMCHQSAITGRVPGFLMNTTVTDRSGYPLASIRYGTMTDETPIKHRFGGWYVTGTIDNAMHSGNVFSTKDFSQLDRTQPNGDFGVTPQASLSTLAAAFDTARYLTGQSDIVGLMVQVHQTAVHTLISGAHDAAKRALAEQASVTAYNSNRNDSTSSRVPLWVSNPRLRGAVERLTRGLLFVDETSFEGEIRGTTSFTRDFAKPGPRDSEGRSLRDFNLKTRLFKYPLSFLIYSEGFNTLPEVARLGVYMRLRSILSGDDPAPEYLKLTAADRKAILEILNDTKPDFVRAAWQ